MRANMEQAADYFGRRSREEAAAAQRASDERARQTHFELARRYAEAAEIGMEPFDGADEASAPLLPNELRILP